MCHLSDKMENPQSETSQYDTEFGNLQGCRFSFLMSYSHPRCHMDVIYDRAVRFATARSVGSHDRDTDMIKHSVDDDPIVDELLAALPKPFLKRLQPETAATALADGSPAVPHASWRRPSGNPFRRCAESSPRHWIHVWPATHAPKPHSPNSTHERTHAMTNTHHPIKRHDMTTWKDAPTRTINVDGVTFAYRELGTGSDIPVVFLHHLTAVLDDWDPRIVDGIAAHHRVITFDNRGVGATGGSVPTTVEQMGTDAIASSACSMLVSFKRPGQRDLTCRALSQSSGAVSECLVPSGVLS